MGTEPRPTYAEGGYVGGGEVPALIHPGECLLKREGDTWRCVRPDHDHDAPQEREPRP